MPLGLSDNLFKRIVSALLLLPPVLYVLWAGEWWFACFLAVGGALMALEWSNLTGYKRNAGIVLALLVASSVGFAQFKSPDIVFLMSTLAVLAAVSGLATQIPALKEGAWWVLGISYVGMPLLALWWLRSAEGGMIVFWVFLITWATDVGGYFAGKGIGGPKLAPKISPKKTWAGLLGGMTLSGHVALVLNLWFEVGADLAVFIVLSAALAVISQVGDLLESSIKRHFDVKDSGGLIPGHGGLLDRVDGLVTVAPVVAVIMLYAPNWLK